MPDLALQGLPKNWKSRCEKESYNNLTFVVPSGEDLLVPKGLRNEPRDIAHRNYALSLGLIHEP